MGVERYGCVAHGLHNLIVVDGIRKCAELQELISEEKEAVKTFTYKSSLLECEAVKMADMKLEIRSVEHGICPIAELTSP